MHRKSRKKVRKLESDRDSLDAYLRRTLSSSQLGTTELWKSEKNLKRGESV